MELERKSRSERKAIDAADALIAAVGIRRGVQCKNWAADQLQVISLLTRIPAERGGASGIRFKQPRDGVCDSSLFEAIQRFQQANGLGSDGVVDPGGPTLRALRRGPGGGSSSGGDAKGRDEKVQEVVDQLATLAGVLTLLVNRKGNLLSDAQLIQARGLLANLERLIGQTGVKPRPKPLPVQNSTVALGLIVVVIALIAALLVLMADPAWRKAAETMSHGIAEGIDETVRKLGLLVQQARQEATQIMIDGIVELNRTAHKIANQGCRNSFEDLERKATKAVRDLAQRPALAPQAIQAFMEALMEFMRCMGPNAAPLLRILRSGWRSGETLIDLFFKAIGGGSSAIFRVLKG
ncbi:MAG: peptidoglycan-binding protein [Acidobacteria bacterium]|nr:peptidoglycan-binding protein [Acidobacteriota bacterium]